MVPKALYPMLHHDDAERAKAVTLALLDMKKLDMAALQAAFDKH